ncbi:MAG: hypothetical protein EWV46_14880 [Microcystis viridis Mv_BB_P_19951000_S69D]|uniref:hypothetical protein n=1 Tax=Hydrotalea sp. TaxID=2881279 RepID=UPI0011959EEE|nr:hypothetical protein [Hydrotalea sp.]TRU84292.1 MAG: hypothetical protein EWV46_14880 [Microcystis viridis Mv_BB_P_19951000_S69D]
MMHNILLLSFLLPFMVIAQSTNLQHIKDSAFASIQMNNISVNMVFPAFTLIDPGTLVVANHEQKLS